MLYPLIVLVLSRYCYQTINKKDQILSVSVVLAARNEAERISLRLKNLLEQDYSPEMLEIIVVSDGSTDATIEKVKDFNDDRIRLIVLDSCSGKAAAVNKAIFFAKNEIIVFADARQFFAINAIKKLVANFADPQVGCVSGELVFLKDKVSSIQTEMGAYWNYEKWIRNNESCSGSVIGATGAIYAIRRAFYLPLPPETILDDVLTPLNIVLQGYRCIFTSEAIAYDTFSEDAAKEWRRKVRTLTGNWQLLSLKPGLLLPWCNPCWWRFISHKIMRLLVPFALVILFVSGLILKEPIYRLALGLQCLLYALALTGLFIPLMRRRRLISFCYFFLIMNVAAATGFWYWLTGKSSTTWKSGNTSATPPGTVQNPV